MSDEINLMIDLIVTAGFNVTKDAGGFVLTKEIEGQPMRQCIPNHEALQWWWSGYQAGRGARNRDG